MRFWRGFPCITSFVLVKAVKKHVVYKSQPGRHPTSYPRSCGRPTAQTSTQLTIKSGAYCRSVFIVPAFATSLIWGRVWLKSGSYDQIIIDRAIKQWRPRLSLVSANNEDILNTSCSWSDCWTYFLMTLPCWKIPFFSASFQKFIKLTNLQKI